MIVNHYFTVFFKFQEFPPKPISSHYDETAPK